MTYVYVISVKYSKVYKKKVFNPSQYLTFNIASLKLVNIKTNLLHQIYQNILIKFAIVEGYKFNLGQFVPIEKQANQLVRSSRLGLPRIVHRDSVSSTLQCTVSFNIEKYYWHEYIYSAYIQDSVPQKEKKRNLSACLLPHFFYRTPG